MTGIALTKLDGTAKGGIIFAIAERLGLPIRLIGVGEGVEDLRDFDARTFVSAVVGREASRSELAAGQNPLPREALRVGRMPKVSHEPIAELRR